MKNGLKQGILYCYSRTRGGDPVLAQDFKGITMLFPHTRG